MILALGTRFAEADSSSWYQGVTFDPATTKFLQIDIDPTEIGRNYPVEIGAVADLKLALAQILEAAKAIKPEGIKRPGLREGIAKAKAEFKESVKAITEDLRFPMTPQRILKDVKEAIPEDALIFTDVGWNKNGVAQQFTITTLQDSQQWASERRQFSEGRKLLPIRYALPSSETADSA